MAIRNVHPQMKRAVGSNYQMSFGDFHRISAMMDSQKQVRIDFDDALTDESNCLVNFDDSGSVVVISIVPVS
jgi:hypothetical protein